jgi:hypothetical protein
MLTLMRGEERRQVVQCEIHHDTVSTIDIQLRRPYEYDSTIDIIIILLGW